MKYLITETHMNNYLTVWWKHGNYSIRQNISSSGLQDVGVFKGENSDLLDIFSSLNAAREFIEAQTK